MPLRNRVTPAGEIVATLHRGTMMGNRGGCLHRPDRTLGTRQWVSARWICCLLSFKGRRREVMAPRRYTELFFLDEATALAAGHRPCFECRRADAARFAQLFAKVNGTSAAADDIDRVLHAQRISAPAPRHRPVARLGTLPPGTFVILDGGPTLVASGGLRRWSMAGYAAKEALRSALDVEVLTPPSTVAVLAAGYDCGLHPTAAD